MSSGRGGSPLRARAAVNGPWSPRRRGRGRRRARRPSARARSPADALEADLDLVGLEGDHAVDAADLAVRVAVRPGGAVRGADVVVVAQPLVRAEGLPLDGTEQALVDVRARDVPTRGEAGLVEHEGAFRTGHHGVRRTDLQRAGSGADVDAVVRVRRMTEDAFVLLVEGVHRPPGEGDAVLELGGVPGRGGELPGGAFGGPVARSHGEPRGVAEILMPGHLVALDQGPGVHVRAGEVGDRVAARFVQQQDVLAVGDPLPVEPHAHTAAQALGEQQAPRQGFGGEEVSDRAGRERPLLPGQSHGSFLPGAGCRGGGWVGRTPVGAGPAAARVPLRPPRPWSVRRRRGRGSPGCTG